ncbi:MAG: hypothetical protein FJ098_00840 [Deltaproteobacteria bacterium]|nr:hypothetical protein [Deltaproteobacteria bacterium]
MKRMTVCAVLLAGALAFAMVAGCDSGGGGGGGGGDDTTPPPEDTAGGDDTTPPPEDTAGGVDTDPGTDTLVEDQGGGEPVDFAAAVEGFGMDGNLVAGVTVEIYDNATGEATGVKQVSDESGKVVFPGLTKGKLYGFKCTLENYKPTFTWNNEVGIIDEETIWIVPNTVFQMALGLAGLQAQPGKSVVAGAIYWLDGQEVEHAVGCATVTAEPATDDIRYMDADNGLPTTIENQPATACAGTKGNGRFVAANLEPGQATLTAVDGDGGTIGATVLWSIADSIAVSNIYANPDVTENPTTAACGCAE